MVLDSLGKCVVLFFRLFMHIIIFALDRMNNEYNLKTQSLCFNKQLADE